ncbi:MAG TPA: hypothetical protein VGD17_01375, partial [Chitinophagaceae bacterium]
NKTRLTDTARRILAKNHPASISTEKENSKIKQQTLTEGKSFRFFAGGGLVRTAGIRDDINTNLMGWEANVKAEKRITQNLSATVSFGVAHFTGRYKSKFNRFRSTGDSTIQNFTLTPLLAGFRYKLGSIMYLSAEAGITFKNKANDRIRPILSPSAGILLPTKGDRKIDIGIRFSHLMVSPSLLGDPVLQTGGYSFLSLRLAYGF